MANSTDFWNALGSWSRFLITSHVRPDPDSIGSEIALSLFFDKLGKENRIVNADPLPENCRFLPKNERVLTWPQGSDFPHDALIVLDGPQVERCGAAAEAAANAAVLVVDHHPYENRIADFAWIDPRASSTGEMLFDFMRERVDLVDADMANCLYTAIMTDTGRFSNANTTQKALSTAAQLAALGALPHELASAYYENVSDGRMRIFGTAAANIKRAAGGAVAYTTLSEEDFERAGIGQEVASELAELPRSLEGVRVAALLRETGGGTKVSLRAKDNLDVKEMAEHFGGGGHHKASGFFLELPLAEAEIVVVRFLEDCLRTRHNGEHGG